MHWKTLNESKEKYELATTNDEIFKANELPKKGRGKSY